MNFRYWLPNDAYLGAAAKEALSEPIAQWSTDWFARTAAAVARIQVEDDGPASAQVGADRSDIGIRMSGVGKRHLLEALVDVSLAEQVRGEGDVHVLDAVAAEATADLVRRVEELLPAPGGSDDEGPNIRYTLSIGRNEVLDIVVPAQSLTKLLRGRFGSARPPSRPLGRRSAALRQTPVVARAILGHAELSLDEVSSLGVGDVLVLDRALSEKVELRLPESESSLARGKLCRNGTQISVQL